MTAPGRVWARVPDPQNDNSSFVKWVNATVGDELEGAWLGTMPGQWGDYGVIEVDGKRRPFALPMALARRLESVEVGTLIKIVYLGKVPLKDGKTMHTFDVYSAGPSGVGGQAMEADDDDASVPF